MSHKAHNLHHFSFSAMAAPCELHLYGEAKHCQQTADLVQQEVHRIEQKYSRYRADSVLSQLNQHAGKPCPIDEETCYLLNYAQACWQQSNGLFDISSGILRNAWNFREAQLPDQALLDSLIQHIGFNQAELTPDQFTMPKNMEIDFGGIGKEYATDKAAQLCQQRGIHSGIIDLGGDLHILGPKVDQSSWQLGVRHPREIGKVFAQLPVYEGGMATSGDYERYFELNSQRYCHLLNPISGYPVQHWASITVLAPSCLLAGSLSTIAMLMEDQALSWLNEQGVHFLAISPDGKHYSASPK